MVCMWVCECVCEYVCEREVACRTHEGARARGREGARESVCTVCESVCGCGECVCEREVPCRTSGGARERVCVVCVRVCGCACEWV